MKEHTCRKCAFYFQRLEPLDKGINVPIKGCVRDVEDPDDCHEYQDKWYAGNDDGFRDSLEEEYMSLDEYRDFLALKEKARTKILRKLWD